MRTILPISPTSWLSAQPNPHPNPQSILDAFEGTPVVYRYSGPETFIRAAGQDAKGRTARAYGGGWWVSREVLLRIAGRLSQYQGWLPDSELKRALPAQYRALTALCRDWNDMSEVVRMDVPAGEMIEAMAGATKEQPEYSHLNPAMRTTPMLRGGAEQVYIKVKNPLWVFADPVFA